MSKKMQKPKYINRLEKLLLSFVHEMDEIRFSSVKKGELEFEDIVKSALSKSFDFALWNTKSTEFNSSFFRLPVLRGICEDLISITFLEKFDIKERGVYIRYLMEYDTVKSITVQEAFLAKNNPGQAILKSREILGDERIEFIMNRPIKKKKAIELGHKMLPSIYQMAEKTGYAELYKYLYYATSKTVHFNPDSLMKMGWGSIDDKGNMQGTFSYKHYSEYYLAFSNFYASYLLFEQIENFKKTLNFSDDFLNAASELKKWIAESDWPEITTFSQMNLKMPSLFERVMMKAMAQMNQDLPKKS